MTAEERARLKERLEARVEELRGALEREAEGSAVAPDNAIGRLTRLDAMQAGYMSEALRRRQQDELARVRRALERVDREDFGQCRRCEAPLPMARLLARPDALLCVACAGAAERTR